MRKFYVFHESFDCYIEAVHVYVEEGYLTFENDDEEGCAIFAPGKWHYFKEVSIENV